MTEADWLASNDPQRMLAFLRGKASDRKLWLFACGSCRRHAPLMADARCRTVLEVGERYADENATSEELAEASEVAYCRRTDLSAGGVSEAIAIAAAFAVVDPAQRDPNLGVMTTVDAVQNTSNDLIKIADFSESGEVERAAQCQLLRDVFGNPFRPVALDPSWRTLSVLNLAGAIYEHRAFDCLPLLAGALEEVGCRDAELLAHCRWSWPHVRGCWALDLVLGKE
jgi:hypothetical protein